MRFSQAAQARTRIASSEVMDGGTTEPERRRTSDRLRAPLSFTWLRITVEQVFVIYGGRWGRCPNVPSPGDGGREICCEAGCCSPGVNRAIQGVFGSGMLLEFGATRADLRKICVLPNNEIPLYGRTMSRSGASSRIQQA